MSCFPLTRFTRLTERSVEVVLSVGGVKDASHQRYRMQRDAELAFYRALERGHVCKIIRE